MHGSCTTCNSTHAPGAGKGTTNEGSTNEGSTNEGSTNASAATAMPTHALGSMKPTTYSTLDSRPLQREESLSSKGKVHPKGVPAVAVASRTALVPPIETTQGGARAERLVQFRDLGKVDGGGGLLCQEYEAGEGPMRAAIRQLKNEVWNTYRRVYEPNMKDYRDYMHTYQNPTLGQAMRNACELLADLEYGA
jgi:hypothetical protein